MPAATPPSLPARYRLAHHIADGGMAAVWEATDELLGRDVAVKVLAPALAADDEARRRFTREARAAARLSSHPHVVTVYDAGEHDGQTFLVMALYPGGTVADRITAGPIPRAQGLDWLEDAASALDAAHAEGVVHRDVKPANLLLDAHGHVAVGDFGIATAAWESAMTSTGMVLGTLAYLAPEQRTGGAATAASDLYALGLVARQLLTGAKPGSDPEPGRSLPPAADAVLARATAERPEDRPATCAGLVRELDKALGSGVQAGGPPRSGEEPTGVLPAATPRVPRQPVSDAGTRVTPRRPREPATARQGADPPVRRAPVRAGAGSRPPGHGGDTGRDVAGPDLSGGRRGGRALAWLAAVALVVAGGAVAVSAFDSAQTDAPARSTTSTAKKKATTTTDEAPAPSAPATTEAPAPAPASKSRADLIAQNDAARAATEGDPAGQIAPLQEAVAGLCVDESDLNCAFALFNLAQAFRFSGQPSEAIGLLERRLSISDNQVDAVRQELAQAQQAAGVAPTADPVPADGKKPKKDKGEKDDG